MKFKDIDEFLEEIRNKKRCKEITKEGKQCQREATADGYCMHHL